MRATSQRRWTRRTGFRRSIPATRYVYFAQTGIGRREVKVGDVVKIGIADDVRKRMRELRAELVFAVPCTYDFAWALEGTLHEEFAAQIVGGRGRWFLADETTVVGGLEWFWVDERLRSLIDGCLKIGRWPWTGELIVRVV